ncbi:MAG TPA: hypothetical protein VJX67_04840 [Blastocatellia bacterium]|nr:hypothetical protein [Blastocatellia bacterium]
MAHLSFRLNLVRFTGIPLDRLEDWFDSISDEYLGLVAEAMYQGSILALYGLSKKD